MSDQWKPTPGPWEIAPKGTYPSGEGFKILGPWRETKSGRQTRYYVAQFMNKDDANVIVQVPELLARVGLMDELVAAVKALLKNIEASAKESFDANDTFDPWPAGWKENAPDEHELVEAVCTILAEIEGAK